MATHRLDEYFHQLKIQIATTPPPPQLWEKTEASFQKQESQSTLSLSF